MIEANIISPTGVISILHTSPNILHLDIAIKSELRSQLVHSLTPNAEYMDYTYFIPHLQKLSISAPSWTGSASSLNAFLKARTAQSAQSTGGKHRALEYVRLINRSQSQSFAYLWQTAEQLLKVGWEGWNLVE
ncbi:hypothetical protein HGRIS_014688 [Hohenbuehelia grisea]|uniref:Uncharacterized protein n=1 Tax=Hohenbuehelia grisea TaxID=104357 RepID=A0ABR3JUB6_9AGAR